MLGVPLEKALFRSSSAPDPSGLTQETNGSPSALDVLFAGTTPPSPVDFLNSSVLHDFIERMTKEYDCLVLDTPPVLVSADAAVLAARASGVVLVARMGKTDWRALDEARKLLAQAGARTLGVVANELNVTRGYGYYRYKYHYYHYRYGRQQPAAV
jgi:tyrosine-protein kinase Etk/Wzc